MVAPRFAQPVEEVDPMLTTFTESFLEFFEPGLYFLFKVKLFLFRLFFISS